jgi:hypothetical protein
MLFKNSVRTSKRTQNVTVRDIDWFIQFREVIVLCSDNENLKRPTGWIQNAQILILKAGGTYRDLKVLRLLYIAPYRNGRQQSTCNKIPRDLILSLGDPTAVRMCIRSVTYYRQSLRSDTHIATSRHTPVCDLVTLRTRRHRTWNLPRLDILLYLMMKRETMSDELWTMWKEVVVDYIKAVISHHLLEGEVESEQPLRDECRRW